MPTYKTLYKGSWVNVETDIDNANNQKQVDVLIYDTDSGSGSVETTIDLEMTDQPTLFETIGNTEDKFDVLKSRRAEINIYSSDSVRIETFASGGDNRWYTEIYYDSVLKFVGWLSISGLQQDFLPNSNVIILTASCGLIFLQDQKLVNFNGNNPVWENRIITYLAWALAGTGHQLDIKCVFNIKEEDSIPINQDGHAPLTCDAIFADTPDKVRVPNTSWFYPGQRFTVTGASSNVGPFTVDHIIPFGASDIDVYIVEDTIGYFALGATFTDLAAEGDGHFFRWIWLLAKSFEDDINTCVNRAEVIRRILGQNAFIIQKDAAWYICRVDEMNDSTMIQYTFDYQGNFVSKDTIDPVKEIGATELLSWMDDSQRKYMERPVKSVELDFPLTTPKETLTNYDLSRGTVVSTSRIDPEGWVLEQTFPAIEPTTTQGYIFLELDSDGNEVSRSLYIASSTSEFFEFRNKDKIYIHAGDRVQISVDWKHDADDSGSHYQLPVAMVRLYADDGTHWFMYMSAGYDSSSPQPYWIESNSSWTTNTRFLYHEGNLDQDDLSQWQTASGTSAPCPANGRLEVLLIHNYKTDTRGKYFTNISFEIKAYVAGTIDKYKSQQYKLSQSLSTVALRKDNVYMSDTIKKYFQGALLKVSGSESLFTGSIIFNGNSISLPASSGYLPYLFTVGKTITTSGTNNRYYTITDVTYHIIGDTVEITVAETLTTVTETATIYEILFALANSFYRGDLLPDGSPTDADLHTYGELQVTDVWNQYNRGMSKFEGTVDHLDSDDEVPDMTHKYRLTDADLSTNGKTFMALHYRQNLHDVTTDTFLHEVFDKNIAKQYPDADFKYIT